MRLISLHSRSTRRSKLQIFADVLRTINYGEYKPTRIMYKSNLSWNPLNKILKNMVDLGLVKERNVGGHKYFFITEKGKEFLELLDHLKKMLAPSLISRSAEIDSLLTSPKNWGNTKPFSMNTLETIKPRIHS